MITYFNADVTYDVRNGGEATCFLKLGAKSSIDNEKALEVLVSVEKLLTALKTIPEHVKN